MNEASYVGKVLIFLGLTAAAFGAIILLLSRLSGGRGWPLPGDIVIRKGPVTIFFPIVTMIIVSVIMTLLLRILFVARR